MPITMQKAGVEFVADNYQQFVTKLRGANTAFESFLGNVNAVARAQGREISGMSQFVDTLIASGKAAITAGGSFGGLGSILTSVGGVVASVMTGPAAPFVAAGAIVLPALWNGAKKAADVIKNVLGAALRGIGQLLSTVGGFVLNLAIKPFEMLGEAIRRIFYISGGVLVADLFRGIVREIKDMGSQAIQAASDFQLLKIRMEGLLARDIIMGVDELGRSAGSFDEALQMVGRDVENVFDWITKLAVRTPFTIEDITNAFTLAKAYGLTTTMTQDLIVATGNFTAGMGLTGEHIQRVIENLGQMIQQGKITGTEIRDLARGSFVPIAAVFEQMGAAAGYTGQQVRDFAKNNSIAFFKAMAKAAGKTTEEIIALADAGKLTTDLFINAFIDMAENQFPNGMERMSRTFETVKSNIKDFVQAIVGFKILAPSMNFLADKLAEMLEKVLEDSRLNDLADQVGQMLLGGLTSGFPEFDAQTVAGNLVSFLQGAFAMMNPSGMLPEAGSGGMGQTSWMTFWENAGVPEWVINSVANLRVAWENVKAWWAENKDVIIGYVNEVLETLGLKDFSPSETFQNATAAIYDFSVWLLENGETVNGYLAGIADSIEHIANVTLPILSGDMKLEDVFSPTALDGMAAGFNDVWVHVQYLWGSLKDLSNTMFELVGLFFEGQSKAEMFRKLIGLLKLPIDILTIAVRALDAALRIVIAALQAAISLASFFVGMGIGQMTVPQNPYMMNNALQGNTTNNNNVTVNASYQNPQSAGSVAYDVRGAMAAIAT